MSLGAYLGKFGKENFELAEDEDYQKWIKKVKKAVLAAVQKQTGTKFVWAEGKGPEEQLGMEFGGWEGLAQLQRFAAHIQFTGFPPTEPAKDDQLDNDEYLLRCRSAMEDETGVLGGDYKFRHLIMTGESIRYIPFDFPEPLLIEEEGNDETTSIGSSFQLYHELNEINRHLLVVNDFGQLDRNESLNLIENAKDPWGSSKWAWMVLHWLSRESVNKKLSIYFE
jgi:hypothetical protein